MDQDITRRSLARLALGASLATPMLGRAARAADDAVSIAVSSNSLAYGGLVIAEKGQIFQKHGLEPNVIRMDSGNAATSALIGGSVQFCTSGMEEVLAARSRGQKIVVVANLCRGDTAVLVLSKEQAAKTGVSPDAPPAERIKALGGMSIGTPSITSAFNAPLTASVEQYGEKVSYIPIAQPAMMAAMKTGAINAFMASSPFWEPAVLQGFGVVWLTTPKPGELQEEFVPISVAVLQTTEDYARAHGPAIAKLRAVFEDVANFIKTQPEKAKQLLAEHYKQVDPKVLELAWKVNAASWTHPTLTQADIDHQMRITKAAGLIKNLDQVDKNAILWPNS